MAGINISLDEKLLSNICAAIQQLAQGRSNSVGQVTLRPNQTTTTVTKAVDKAAVNMSLGAAVFLSPRTANAQSIAYSWWISSKAQGSFVISHASNPASDLTFDFEIRGG